MFWSFLTDDIPEHDQMIFNILINERISRLREFHNDALIRSFQS